MDFRGTPYSTMLEALDNYNRMVREFHDMPKQSLGQRFQAALLEEDMREAMYWIGAYMRSGAHPGYRRADEGAF